MDQQKQPFNPLLAVLAALAALFFVFPLIGMITGAPWGNVFGIITNKSSLDALGLSIIASLASTAIALLFGFPLAWLLARNQFRGKGLVRGLTTLPMVLPPVVGGIALLLAYGRRGFIGQPLDRAFGISLPFTLAGVIVAESFVAMPFFVITVESGLRSMNRRLEDAARSLGAKRLTVFRRVTLPLICPDGPATARRRPGGAGRHGPGRPRPAHPGPPGEPAHRPDVPGLPAVPHLSAVENVAFGLRAKGTDKKAARERATQALARLGLEGALTSARPGAMSGGQQQRVAMARALVTEPKLLLLLDEPLAALDVSTKTDVRRLLREALRQSEAANVLVTHDLLDAVALGDRMAVAVSRQQPEGHEPNTWAGQISAVDLMGDRVRVRIDGTPETPEITAEVSPRAVDELKLDDGGELWASVNPAAITVYPP